MSCDFTYNHYREILHLAKEKNYNIMGCNEYIHHDNDSNKLIIMRHDIDTFPSRAYDIAKIEYEEGIRSTYFFRVFSNTYNIFGYDTMNIIREIEKMGHEIGYHAEPVDVAAATNWEIDSMQAFQIGKSALELVLGHTVEGVASHREATGYNNLKEFLELKTLQELQVKYEAYDSTGLNLFNNSLYITDGYEWYWRIFKNGKITQDQRCICQILKEEISSPIYCLIHPNSWYESHFHRVII